MKVSDTKIDTTRKDKFLALVEEELPKTYDWAKSEFKLKQFMSMLRCLAYHGISETIILSDAPVLERCWRAVGMRCKMTRANMKKL
jgi:hypothetical protein